MVRKSKEKKKTVLKSVAERRSLEGGAFGKPSKNDDYILQVGDKDPMRRSISRKEEKRIDLGTKRRGGLDRGKF